MIQMLPTAQFQNTIKIILFYNKKCMRHYNFLFFMATNDNIDQKINRGIFLFNLIDFFL